MKASDRYSARAIYYSKYRWDYAADAVRTIFDECGLTDDSVVADIGSGTGKLTSHFAGRVRTIFAVEPNPEMRAVAAEALQYHSGYCSIDGASDATTIPDHSIDMIIVGRALHWFPPNSTKAEFRRILKRHGWLAIFRVPCTDYSFKNSLKVVQVEENGWDIAASKERIEVPPLSFYFGHDDLRRVVVPGIVRETWEAFLHRIDSLSPAPGPDHPLRLKLEEGLHRVFNEYSVDGILTVSNATEAVFGRME